MDSSILWVRDCNRSRVLRFREVRVLRLGMLGLSLRFEKKNSDQEGA